MLLVVDLYAYKLKFWYILLNQVIFLISHKLRFTAAPCTPTKFGNTTSIFRAFNTYFGLRAKVIPFFSQ
jgi:hypothetical protein